MSVKVNDQIEIGGDKLTIIAGPCMAESLEICLETGRFLKELCEKLELNYIFKASYDKANRSSGSTQRGPGRMAGLAMLQDVKNELNVPIVTDIHETSDVQEVAQVADILQIPAFLCRQTDLLVAAARSQRIVNVKKGQFMAPGDMGGAVDKIKAAGNDRVLLTERGATFGYNNLVVDMRGIEIMHKFGVPVVFDATHSVQLPGGGSCSGGQREFVMPLAKAATAVGIDALFLEVHPSPDNALSDGPNSLDFKLAEQVIKKVKDIYECVRKI